MEKYPGFEKEAFRDFVYYPDTVGGATRTAVAIPVILTGQAWTEPVSYSNI